MSARTLAALGAVALLALPPAAGADEARTRQAARAALARYGSALVTVRLTVRMRMVHEGRQQDGPESTQEVAGTLVSADGLTVVSDFSTNPAALFEDERGPRIETETSEVRILLQDGRELPARFVLRDSDLDLAFLAPVDPVAGLPFVPFEKGTPAPAPLDDLVLLGQLGRSLNRAVAVTVGRVRAVVRRPRTFVVPGSPDAIGGLGSPAFDDHGRPVGLLVLRRPPGGAPEARGLRDVIDAMAPVVIGAGDIRDEIGQATAARSAPAGDATGR
jgi:hypothetical protein